MLESLTQQSRNWWKVSEIEADIIGGSSQLQRFQVSLFSERSPRFTLLLRFPPTLPLSTSCFQGSWVKHHSVIRYWSPALLWACPVQCGSFCLCYYTCQISCVCVVATISGPFWKEVMSTETVETMLCTLCDQLTTPNWIWFTHPPWSWAIYIGTPSLGLKLLFLRYCLNMLPAYY